MNSTVALKRSQLRQARGSAKEIWGKISKNNRTRLEGRMEQMSGRSQEKLLRIEAQTREEIEEVFRSGQQKIEALGNSLAATANQALGRPAKRKTSLAWIPAIGSAVLLTAVGIAVLTYNTDALVVHDTATNSR